MSAPSLYRPAFADIARTLAAAGARNCDVARALGVHPKTLQAWKRRHPALADAIGAGKAAFAGTPGIDLFRKATGYSLPSERVFVADDGALVRVATVDHVPPSDRAAIAWLHGRRPDRWRRPPVRVTARRPIARPPIAQGLPRQAGGAASPGAAAAGPPPARPAGSGSRYDPAFAPLVRRLAAEGALDRDLARACGVHRDTLRQWQARHPAFAAAIRAGKAIADDAVEHALFRKATGYGWTADRPVHDGGAVARAATEIRLPPSPRAAAFWLAHRRPDQAAGECAVHPVARPRPVPPAAPLGTGSGCADAATAARRTPAATPKSLAPPFRHPPRLLGTNGGEAAPPPSTPSPGRGSRPALRQRLRQSGAILAACPRPARLEKAAPLFHPVHRPTRRGDGS